MPDSPHTSAPMVMHGRALALKNTCQNASGTSVEKHLSWSPDIHPTARWVPSTPHRAHPAGHPPTRHPGAVGTEEREYDEGCDVVADGKRRRPQNTARRRRSVGQLRRPAPRRRQAATEGPPRHRLPRRHTPAAAECGNNKTEDDEVGPRAQHTTAGVQAIASTRIPTTTSHGRGTPTPTPAPPPTHHRSHPHTDHDEVRGKPDALPDAHGPSAVALQQRCHRTSAPARRPFRPPMPRPRPQRPPRPSESRIRSPLRNRTFCICTGAIDMMVTT